MRKPAHLWFLINWVKARFPPLRFPRRFGDSIPFCKFLEIFFVIARDYFISLFCFLITFWLLSNPKRHCANPPILPDGSNPDFYTSIILAAQENAWLSLTLSYRCKVAERLTEIKNN